VLVTSEVVVTLDTIIVITFNVTFYIASNLFVAIAVV